MENWNLSLKVLVIDALPASSYPCFVIKMLCENREYLKPSQKDCLIEFKKQI